MKLSSIKNRISIHILKSKQSSCALDPKNQTGDCAAMSEKGKSGSIRIFLLALILLISFTAVHIIKANAANADDKIQKGIAGEIIRFHVIANSDSSEDQALKLKVKDALVNELSATLKSTKSITEARDIITENLPSIQQTSEKVISENGYAYPVAVSLAPCLFPIKVYGDYTFPAGNYEALRVQIGEAKGQNWWCVMFPPLCFVDSTYSIVDEDTDRQLKYLLTEEEYDSLKVEKAPVKIKFKLWESVKKFIKK